MKYTLAYILFLCLYFNISAQPISYDVSGIAPELITNAHSVIRYDSTHILVEPEAVTYTEEYAVTVMGKKEEGNLSFVKHFNKDVIKINSIEIKIFDANGIEIKDVKKKEIEEIYAFDGSSLISDDKLKYYKYNTTKYPVTLYYKYSYVDKSPFYLRPWYPYNAMNTSVEYSALYLENKSDITLQTKEKAVENFRIKNTDNIIHYRATNIKAKRKEKLMPASRKVFPQLQYSLDKIKYHEHNGLVKDWNEFGIWTYENLFMPKNDIDYEVLKADLSDVVNDDDTKLVKAKKLYKYLQDNTRYILISLEDGGWSPLSTNTVHTKKYGDCKALAFYYHTLLDAYEIPSNIVLINAGNTKLSADQSFFNTTQFNHAITQVSIADSSYFVDCTMDNAPFGYVSDFDDDRSVLIINNKESYIGKTPTYPRVKIMKDSISFNTDGQALSNISLESIGTMMGSKFFKLEKKNDKDTKKYHKKLFKGYTNLNIKDYRYEFNEGNLAFTESYELTSDKMCEKYGDYLMLPMNYQKMSIPKLPKDKKREWPIEVKREEQYDYTSVVSPPTGYSLIPLPDNKNIESKYGNYKTEYKRDNANIIIKRTLKINKGTYPNSEYGEVKSFFDKVRKSEKSKLKFTNKS